MIGIQSIDTYNASGTYKDIYITIIVKIIWAYDRNVFKI